MNSNYVGQFVGVIPPVAFDTLGFPKQLLLMFDALAIDLGGEGLSETESEIVRRSMGEIDWLIKAEMLTLLSGLQASQNDTPSSDDIVRARRHLDGKSVTPERMNAYLLRKKGIDAVPVMNPVEDLDLDEKVDRDAVIRLTIREFPVPSDQTPWEAIEEFRGDRDAMEKFWDLKKWMNGAAKSGLSHGEVTDDLRGMIADYQKSMEVHKLKYRSGFLEMALTTTTSAIESFLRLRWSNAVKSVFDLRRQDIALMEDERNAPGREVGYIVRARERFS